MQVVCWAVTMYFVLLGWLIFRVTNLKQLLVAMKSYVFFDGQWQFTGLSLNTGATLVPLATFAIFIVLHAWSFFAIRWAELLDRLPSRTLPICYAVVAWLFYVAWPVANAPFIYFQF